MSEPGTIPPPRTKSSSSSPVFQRVYSPPLTSCRGLAVGRSIGPVRAPREGDRRVSRRGVRPFVVFRTGSSTRVFQAPQAEHWPAQRIDSFPQSVQKKRVFVAICRNTPEVLSGYRREWVKGLTPAPRVQSSRPVRS